jgi:hypothetical protein
MSIILATCYIVVVKDEELRTGMRGRSEWRQRQVA